MEQTEQNLLTMKICLKENCIKYMSEKCNRHLRPKDTHIQTNWWSKEGRSTKNKSPYGYYILNK